MLIVILSFVISFVLVAFMLPHVLILSLRKRLIDPVDPRKVHSVPASRLGGLTFFPAMLFSMWLCVSLTHLAQSVCGYGIDIEVNFIMETLALLTLYLVGVYDDVLGVSYRQKFFAQIFAAVIVVLAGVYFKTLHGLFGINEISPYIGVPITLFIYVFVVNAINLIDGIDGLASLLSIMALAVYGILMYHNGDVVDSIFVMATLGALVPFCIQNVFGIKKGAGSKIFMGDTGAMVIGMVLGIMAVKIWNMSYVIDTRTPIESIYHILAYTMLIVPCFDVVRIILHRYRQKRPLFMPDRNHIHHKFIDLGFSPRRSLGWIITINLLFVAINLILSTCLNITMIVAIDVVVWTFMHIYISRLIQSRLVAKS